MTVDPPGGDRDRPKCGGARRGEGAGQMCTRPAGWGTDHVGVGRCKLHGGKTQSHGKAAQRTQAEIAMRTYGIRRVGVPPAVALLEEFEWSLGHVAWLRDMVAELQPDALVWGKSEEHEKLAGEFPGVDTKFLAAPSVWLRLYHDERRMMLDLGKTIETLKLAERHLEISDRLGEVLRVVVSRVLARRGVDAGAAEVQAWIGEEIHAALGGPKQIEGTVAA